MNYLDDMYIRGNSARDEELQGEARPDGTSSKIGNSACDSMIVNAWSTPDFALKYNSDSSKGVGDERVGFAFSYLINDGDSSHLFSSLQHMDNIHTIQKDLVHHRP